MNDRIELTGTPIWEGRDGFFGSYLHFIQTVYNTLASPENFENSKACVIAMIRVQIAAIPDEKTREKIYNAISDDIEAAWREEGRITGKKDRNDVTKQRNFSYSAHVDIGIGMISAWYDGAVGIITRNSIGRGYALGEE